MEDISPRGRRHLGARQETLAISYLAQQGLHLIERNYQCRLGELDLIMGDGDQLVFVEVRYRKDRRFGRPVETVDYRKQRKLLLCARHYLMCRQLTESVSCRFDVLGITGDGPAQYCWVRDAFQLA